MLRIGIEILKLYFTVSVYRLLRSLTNWKIMIIHYINDYFTASQMKKINKGSHKTNLNYVQCSLLEA